MNPIIEGSLAVLCLSIAIRIWYLDININHHKYLVDKDGKRIKYE